MKPKQCISIISGKSLPSSKTGKMSGSISGKIAIWSINQYLKKNENNKNFYHRFNFACVSLLVNAQLSTNELPFSFRVENQHLFIQKNAQINSYKALLPKTVEELNTEDQENEGDNENVPPRLAILYLSMGYDQCWQLDCTNKWRQTLDNGISSPNALSINLLYDKFWLPEGTSLFLYSKDKKQYMGGFTSINNKGDSINLKGFATVLFKEVMSF